MLEKGLWAICKLRPTVVALQQCRFVQKDWRGPQWDFERYKVVNPYDKDFSYQGSFRKRTTMTERWNYYNQVVWRPNYKYDDGEAKTGEIFFVAENVRHSPLKLWYVCHLIRGRSVDDAAKQLQYLPRHGAVIMRKVLEDAVDDAVERHGIEYRSNLWIAEAFAYNSVVMKGLRRHARERWGTIHYRWSNVHIRLQEGKPPPFSSRPEQNETGFSLGRRYLDDLRSRRIKYGI